MKASLFLIVILLFLPTRIYAHESNTDNSVIIHMDETGFNPKDIKIKKNTEVIFENTSSQDRWPAGDDHPSHMLYDGTTLEEHCGEDDHHSFDSCKPILPGESWSFQFDKEGIHSFHDHLWPQYIGTITIEAEESELLPEQKDELPQNFITQFQNFFKTLFEKMNIFQPRADSTLKLKNGELTNESYKTYKEKLSQLVINENPTVAIELLKSKSKKNEKVLAICHDLIHVIGRTAYNKYGSFQEAVAFQEDFCNSGYIHGIFEAYFQNTENPLNDLPAQCDQYAMNKRPFDLWQCHHGIGHGYMYLTGGDIDKTLQLCSDSLPENISHTCQNGAYMELFNAEILANEKKSIDRNNPFNTCATRSTGKAHCYLYLPTYLSQTLNKSYEEIFKECEKYSEKNYISTCIAGTSSEAIKRNMETPESIFALCDKGRNRYYQDTCASALVSMYMNQTASYEEGKKVCQKAPGHYKKLCRNTVEGKKLFFEYSL